MLHGTHLHTSLYLQHILTPYWSYRENQLKIAEFKAIRSSLLLQKVAPSTGFSDGFWLSTEPLAKPADDYDESIGRVEGFNPENQVLEVTYLQGDNFVTKYVGLPLAGISWFHINASEEDVNETPDKVSANNIVDERPEFGPLLKSYVVEVSDEENQDQILGIVMDVDETDKSLIVHFEDDTVSKVPYDSPKRWFEPVDENAQEEVIDAD